MIDDELNHDLLFQRAVELKLHLHDSIVFDQLIRNMRFLEIDKGKSNNDLFQHALDMRLHLRDEVVKRRLIEKMKQRLLIINPPAEVSKAQINNELLLVSINSTAHHDIQFPTYLSAQVERPNLILLSKPSKTSV